MTSRSSWRRRWWPALLVCFASAVPVLAQAPAALEPVFVPVAPLGPTVVARPGASDVFDLQACLAAAEAANDSLQAERQRRHELSGQKLQALSNGLPSIDLVSDWTRRRDPSFALDPTFGGGGGGGFGTVPGADPWFNDWLAGFGSFIPAVEDIPASTYWTTRVTVNWELNIRKILGAVGAANLGLDRQNLVIEAAEQATQVSVVEAYYRVIMLAEAVNAVEAQYANQRELLSLTRMRYDLGVATRLDTLQAAVQLANIEPAVRSYRQQVGNAGARLNVLMGRDPRAPLEIANEAVLEIDPIDRDQALLLAATRPDLQAAERVVSMLERQRQTQSADRWWPYLTLYGSYGWVGTDIDTQFDTGHDSWTVSAAVNLPLFNGLHTSGQLRQTRAQIRRTEIELQGYRRQAQVAALTVLNNLEAARENLAAAQLNLERAEEALAESLLMYRLGQTSYLSVLDAESGHLTARQTLIESRYQVLTLTAALKQAVGHAPAVPLTAIPGLVAGAQSRG
ncbi:MAG: TolC family protein [Candidatus Krumholzibacteriia bacterium]